MGDMERAPYEPQPYDSGGEAKDETVECPNCHKMDAPDARFCDQCGFKLEGAEGVKVHANARSAIDLLDRRLQNRP